MSMRIELANTDSVLRRFQKIPKELGGTRLGIYVAQRAAALMDEYVPMDTGMLAQNYIIHPFVVEYTQPYAHYQYEGTDFNFSKDKHPNATAHWGQAMFNAKGDQLTREIRAYIKQLVR